MNAIYRHGSVLMLDHTPATALTAGDIVGINGQAAIVHSDIAAGDLGAVACPTGSAVYEVRKAANVVILDGGRVYWDPVSETASFRRLTAGALYLGLAVGDYAATAATLLVRVNAVPEYLVDIAEDPVDSEIVLTAGTPQLRRLGGAHSLKFSATAEAQKVDLLSKDGFAPDAGVIVEFAVEVVDNGDAAAPDFNIGVANGTHASDADAITESCFVHIDGNALDIKAESDDGATEVAATDTTVDYAEGTRFEGWIDLRNPADIQIYINGVLVLPDTVFRLDAATGPMKLIAHLEKTSDDTPGEFHVDWLRARLAR